MPDLTAAATEGWFREHEPDSAQAGLQPFRPNEDNRGVADALAAFGDALGRALTNHPTVVCDFLGRDGAASFQTLLLQLGPARALRILTAVADASPHGGPTVSALRPDAGSAPVALALAEVNRRSLLARIFAEDRLERACAIASSVRKEFVP